MGIPNGVATKVVDEGFHALGWSYEDISNFDFPDKLRPYCMDEGGLTALKSHIMNVGLPAINCRIRDEFLQDISLNSTYLDLCMRVGKCAVLNGGVWQ